MKIFVAGATGAIGRELVPRLVARGHEVTGTTRSENKTELLSALGARPAVVDAVDADAVAQAVAESEPEVIIHELTALSGMGANFRKFSRMVGPTNRLRIEGTDHLLAAGQAVGARRFIAQSFAPFVYARTGPSIKTEEDALDPNPPEQMKGAIEAIRHVEQTVSGITWADGLVMRYGGFYGPGTSMAVDPDGEQVAPIRQRKFPVVGDGGGVWSFVHIADAAEATALAVERGDPGVYNIVDDSPSPVNEWLPKTAAALGAKPPRHFPEWLGRLFAGDAAVTLMTEVRGSSNAKAKRELGWQPEHPSVWQSLTNGQV